MYEAKLIAPLNSGLVNYYKPYLVSQDAFTTLENAYTSRGFVKKREGTSLLARTPIWNTITNITNASPPVVTTATNHNLLSGDMVWLEGVVGATDLNQNSYVITVLSLTTFSLQYLSGFVFLPNAIPPNDQYLEVTPGSNVAADGVGTAGNIYLPILGTRIYILPGTGNELLFVFNSKKVYQYNPGAGTLTDITFDEDGTAFFWKGTKDSFYYSSNYANAIWVTNNNDTDQIKYYNGSVTDGWNTTFPVLVGTIPPTILTSSLLILPYKGYLVALNVTENDTQFQNRATWSQQGTPYTGIALPTPNTAITLGSPTIITSPAHGLTTGDIVGLWSFLPQNPNILNGKTFVVTVIDANNYSIPPDTSGTGITVDNSYTQLMGDPPTPFVNDPYAWRRDIPGKGGFNDADTTEAIISAEIINDVMIVGFQFSEWRLRFTGDQTTPFIWERISTSFGEESTFGSIAMDEGKLGVSRRGFIRSTQNRVERFDMAVFDKVDQIQTDIASGVVGFSRVHSVRDFNKRLIYWTYGEQQGSNNTPNKLLCYNYQDDNFNTFDQSFTTLALYKQTTDNIWATWTTPWAGDTSTWTDPFEQLNAIIIVAGQQNGNVCQFLDPNVSSDIGSPLSTVMSNYNFNITTKKFNPYIDKGKKCRLQYFDVYIDSNSVTPILVSTISQAPSAVVTTVIPHNLVTGQSVQMINLNSMPALNNTNFTVTVTSATTFSIPFNTTIIGPYTDLEGTVNVFGEITYQHFVDDNPEPVLQRRINTAQLGVTGKYVRIFCGVNARFHQIALTLSDGTNDYLPIPPAINPDNQLDDPIKGQSPFSMQGIVIHTRPEGIIKS
jgi:hypothetical protein